MVNLHLYLESRFSLIGSFVLLIKHVDRMLKYFLHINFNYRNDTTVPPVDLENTYYKYLILMDHTEIFVLCGFFRRFINDIFLR